MQYKGKDVFKWRTPRSGFRYDITLDWELAAHWRGYSREAFSELDGDEQARIVALFRIHHQMEAVLAKVRADAERRAQRSKGGP